MEPKLFCVAGETEKASDESERMWRTKAPETLTLTSDKDKPQTWTSGINSLLYMTEWKHNQHLYKGSPSTGLGPQQ